MIFQFSREIWEARAVINTLALTEIRKRYLGSYLGIFWAFAQPIITIFIFWFVFELGFKTVPVDDFPFLLWVSAGMVPWFFISDALLSATGCILEQKFLVDKIKFRISMLPLIKILAALYVQVVFLLLLAGLFALYGRWPGIYLLQVPYYLLCIVVLVAGVTWATSALVVFVQDMNQIVGLCVQFGFWLTPIFWPLSILPEEYHAWVTGSPLYYIIRGFRETFIFGRWFWDAPRTCSLSGFRPWACSVWGCSFFASCGRISRTPFEEAMNNAAIVLHQVTKVYRLYASPFDRVKEALLFFRPPRHRVFKALDEMSFSVGRGEFVGIIGQNGSGKSTLLKLVTGVSNPTSGTVSVQGRISALLELGAGFNPEMTGIENIYFAGTFMGRTRAEIDASLEDIVAFADIGEYIHQPVKLLRVAFALAINVEPDILVVDEALSVGDIRFQQKCLRRIEEFRAAGRTILFVTHDLGAVRNFCDRAIWIDGGRIREEGEPVKVAKNYASYMSYKHVAVAGAPAVAETRADEGLLPWDDVSACSSFGDGRASITGACLFNEESARKAAVLAGGEEVSLHLRIKALADIASPLVGFELTDRFGTALVVFNTELYQEEILPLTAGKEYHFLVRFIFPHILDGTYQMSVAVADGHVGVSHVQNHWVHDAVLLQVQGPDLVSKYGGLLRIEVLETHCV